jgi:hypothetical protein
MVDEHWINFFLVQIQVRHIFWENDFLAAYQFLLSGIQLFAAIFHDDRYILF